MSPIALLAAGAVALACAVAILRSFGPGYRIGRLLATTPALPIAEVLARAKAGDDGYVQVTGRIDAADEFEDEHHRPLVFRRRRIEVRGARGWEPIDESREAVPFEINEGLDSIGIDVDALGPGLVVIPREALGSAADARDRVPADVPDGTPVRLRVDQVSSVEHAIVLGHPRLDPDGTVRLTAGRGRPLVLTTLERPEAMRLLAGGRRTRPLLASGLLLGGAVLVVAGSGWAIVGGLR